MSDLEISDNETAVDSSKGLANVMAKILAKSAPKRVILAKSKTERELKEVKKKKQKINTESENIVTEEDGTVSFPKKKKKVIDEDSSSEDEDPILKRERHEKVITYSIFLRSWH